jgi:hypothetical protein
VIDLSRLPSHGRNVGAWLRGSKSTRHIPLIFVAGEPGKVAAIQKDLPDATYVSHARLIGALKRVKPLKNPVIPKQMMQSDPQRTTAQKLGIREGMRVGIIDPPPGYARVIGTLPEGGIRSRCGSCMILASSRRRYERGACWRLRVACGLYGGRDGRTA